jgi:hypothetical protein
MYKYALINKETNVVENLILWDGGDSWSPPNTHITINAEGIVVDIGYTYSEGTFTAPERVEPPSPRIPTLTELQEQLITLTAQIQALANTQ